MSTGTTHKSVKTAISLEGRLLREIDAVAEELQIPRSRLLAEAAREFLRKHENAKLLGALNEAHGKASSDEDLARRRSWKQQHRRRIEGKW